MCMRARWCLCLYLRRRGHEPGHLPLPFLRVLLRDPAPSSVKVSFRQRLWLRSRWFLWTFQLSESGSKIITEILKYHCFPLKPQER